MICIYVLRLAVSYLHFKTHISPTLILSQLMKIPKVSTSFFFDSKYLSSKASTLCKMHLPLPGHMQGDASPTDPGGTQFLSTVHFISDIFLLLWIRSEADCGHPLEVSLFGVPRGGNSTKIGLRKKERQLEWGKERETIGSANREVHWVIILGKSWREGLKLSSCSTFPANLPRFLPLSALHFSTLGCDFIIKLPSPCGNTRRPLPRHPNLYSSLASLQSPSFTIIMSAKSAYLVCLRG